MKIAGCKRITGMICLVMAFAALMVTPAVAYGAEDHDCGNRTWYLHQNEPSVDQRANLHEMTEDIMPTVQVELEAGDTAYWIEPDCTGIMFPESKTAYLAGRCWRIHVRTATRLEERCGQPQEDDLDADIGIWDPSGEGGFNEAPELSTALGRFGNEMQGEYGFHYWEWELQSGSFAIPKGCYLALRIHNMSQQDHMMQAPGNPHHELSCSWVKSPCSDPVPIPPVPELPTVALTAVGLAAVGGFVLWRKNKKSAVAG